MFLVQSACFRDQGLRRASHPGENWGSSFLEASPIKKPPELNKLLSTKVHVLFQVQTANLVNSLCLFMVTINYTFYFYDGVPRFIYFCKYKWTKQTVLSYSEFQWIFVNVIYFVAYFSLSPYKLVFTLQNYH